jgi:hypothetical protein
VFCFFYTTMHSNLTFFSINIRNLFLKPKNHSKFLWLIPFLVWPDSIVWLTGRTQWTDRRFLIILLLDKVINTGQPQSITWRRPEGGEWRKGGRQEHPGDERNWGHWRGSWALLGLARRWEETAPSSDDGRVPSSESWGPSHRSQGEGCEPRGIPVSIFGPSDPTRRGCSRTPMGYPQGTDLLKQTINHSAQVCT